MKLKHDKLLSNLAFNFNPRHYIKEAELKVKLIPGGAVHVDPGFSHLTPRLLSSVETKT